MSWDDAYKFILFLLIFMVICTLVITGMLVYGLVTGQIG